MVQLKITGRRTLLVHNPNRKAGPRHMGDHLIVAPTQPVYPMIIPADFTIEIPEKRARAVANPLNSHGGITGIAALKLLGIGHLEICSSDLDSKLVGFHDSRGFFIELNPIRPENILSRLPPSRSRRVRNRRRNVSLQPRPSRSNRKRVRD